MKSLLLICFFTSLSFLTTAHDCEGTVIDAPEEMHLTFDGEPYKTISLEWLGVNIEYPCGTFSITLWVKREYGYSSDLDIASSEIGKTLPVRAFVNFSHDETFVIDISLIVDGVIEEIDCTEKIVEIPEIIEVVFDGEPNIKFTTGMLNAHIEDPCDAGYTYGFDGPTNNHISQDQIGMTLPFSFTVNFNDGISIQRNLLVVVSGVGSVPVLMYIEDVDFNAGEEFSVDIWSQDLIKLNSWGLEMHFENIEILAIQTSDHFEDIPHNIYSPDKKVIRALWYPFDALPIDVKSGETWFTLVLKSEVVGSTLDIFQNKGNHFNSIFLESEDGSNVFEFGVDFNCVIAPKISTSTTDAFQDNDISIYPNPSSSRIIIDGLPEKASQIEIVNTSGQVISRQLKNDNNSELTLDISHLAQGIYAARVYHEDKITSSVFCKN